MEGWKTVRADQLVNEWAEEKERKYKDGKLMSMFAEVWKPNGEKCPETNLKGGTGLVFFYHEYGWKQ